MYERSSSFVKLIHHLALLSCIMISGSSVDWSASVALWELKATAGKRYTVAGCGGTSGNRENIPTFAHTLWTSCPSSRPPEKAISFMLTQKTLTCFILLQSLRYAAERKYGPRASSAAYIVTEVIKAERCIVCESEARGAHVTVNIASLAGAATAAADAGLALSKSNLAKLGVVLDHSKVRFLEYPQNAVIAYAIQGLTWSEKDGLAIDQSTYKVPSWAQRHQSSWVNRIWVRN